MRIDAYLCQSGMLSSRTEAKNLIKQGAVAVNGKTVTKPAFEVDDEVDTVEVDRSSIKYVSRGGLKLSEALERFDIDVSGKNAIDVGASSGGFTDCLLQNGARHVIAVDSGSGQMAPSLREDPRVTVVENYNARYMKPQDFAYSPELAVMDVSFISATLIIPSLYNCLASGADYVLLIKPQFEVGKSGVGKGGIVKNATIRDSAVERVLSSASALGFECRGVIQSPIKGGDGNVEFLAHFVKKP